MKSRLVNITAALTFLMGGTGCSEGPESTVDIAQEATPGWMDIVIRSENEVVFEAQMEALRGELDEVAYENIANTIGTLMVTDVDHPTKSGFIASLNGKTVRDLVEIANQRRETFGFEDTEEQ